MGSQLWKWLERNELVFNFSMQQLDLCKPMYDAYEKELNMTNTGTTIVRCPPFFDNLLCWPSVNASKIAIQSCPPAWIMGYSNVTIEKLLKHMFVIQTCGEDGKWHKEDFWKNYGSCVPNYAFYVLDSTDEWRYSWHPEDLLFIDWFPIIAFISYIGYATSFATMLLAMMIFCLFKRLRNPTNKLHMHLFATFIMKALMMLLKYWKYSVEGIGLVWNIGDEDIESDTNYNQERSVIICKLLRTLSNYIIMANYSWMLMEGLYLYNLISLPILSDTGKTTWYILLGWGLPGLIIVIWLAIRITIADTPCWAAHEYPSLFLIIRIPIIISLLINFRLFQKIVGKLYIKIKTSGHLQQRWTRYKRCAKSTIVLIPLVGAHYFFFMGLSYYNDPIVETISAFCYQFFTSFQGTFVALLQCLLKGEARTEIRRVWRTQWSKRDVFISFIYGHREVQNSGRRKDNRKRHRTAGDNSTNFTDTAMRELPIL